MRKIYTLLVAIVAGLSPFDRVYARDPADKLILPVPFREWVAGYLAMPNSFDRMLMRAQREQIEHNHGALAATVATAGDTDKNSSNLIAEVQKALAPPYKNAESLDVITAELLARGWTAIVTQRPFIQSREVVRVVVYDSAG